ncbi:hypothetical protein Patl1_22603 [Pistacia atlantica]|uniref:Uncharacterized protein n=2 Tax=Pistacia atlantica TaxID=434234 RepID=A0ACC1A052_9ROSI|nr:hypothetical protein Patl1_22593 [Pistacia atlantica]KAJ0079672.1 hypothetical protein Patl1_22603 [Pistacia atlantica]
MLMHLSSIRDHVNAIHIHHVTTNIQRLLPIYKHKACKKN